MSDTLQRFLFENTPIRGELIQLDATWQAVLERHDYPPAVAALLGESMAAAALLAASIKFDGMLTLQVQGDGPVSMLVVEATAKRTLRGLAHWRGGVPESGLAAQFGSGRLVITIDPGQGMDRYQGIVALEGESLAGALEGYLARSEQLQTRLWLSADGSRAGGLLLQRLPGELADTDAWNRAETLGATVTRDEVFTLAPRDVIRRLFHEEDLRLFEPEPVSFRCSCTRERVANMLRGLGPDEVESIIEEQGAIEVACEFCNHHYRFDAVDAAGLFAPGNNSDASPTLH